MTQTNPLKNKFKQGLQWRLQSGQRPPKKSDAERSNEQKMIEEFMARNPQSKVEQKKKDEKLQKSDKKLMERFSLKHLT